MLISTSIAFSLRWSLELAIACNLQKYLHLILYGHALNSLIVNAKLLVVYSITSDSTYLIGYINQVSTKY